MIEGRKEMREMDKPLLVKTMLPPEVTAKMLEALKPVYDALDAADTDTKYTGGSILIEMGKSGFTNAIFIPIGIASALYKHTKPIYGAAEIIDLLED